MNIFFIKPLSLVLFEFILSYLICDCIHISNKVNENLIQLEFKTNKKIVQKIFHDIKKSCTLIACKICMPICVVPTDFLSI